MSIPPKSTLVIDQLPSGWLVGVDLQFCQTNEVFKGFKLIPDGFHVVHWGADQSSMRSAMLFVAQDPSVILLRWNKAEERMETEGDGIGELDVSAMKSRLGEHYQFMVPVSSEDNDDDSWSRLTEHISQDLIDRMPKYVSSTSTTEDENEILRESLHKSASKRGTRFKSGGKEHEDAMIQQILDKNEDDLPFSGVAKQTWPDNCPVEQITKHSLDKSWYLEHVFIRGSSFQRRVLGEMQLSFVFLLTLGNFSASRHWLELLKLCLECDDASQTHRDWFNELLSLVSLQLSKCPQEYIDEFLEPDKFGRWIARYSESNRVSETLYAQLEAAGISVAVAEDEDDLPEVVTG